VVTANGMNRVGRQPGGYILVGADGNAPRTRLPISLGNGFTDRRPGQPPIKLLVGPAGIEPATNGLKVRCSTE